MHGYCIALTTKFYLCNILQLQSLTKGITLDNNVTKLLRTSESACIAHGIFIGDIV